MTEPLVVLERAVIGYRGRGVVEADFELDRGDVVALLGPNGSGKSTLVKGILGLAEQLAGSISLFGVPAASFQERFRIGYVPQGQTSSGPLRTTVTEVVTSGRLARKRRFQRITAADRLAVGRAIEVVGLGDRAGVAVSELSGGQHRRALIARALASEAEVLILDEPLAGVDHASQVELADTLAELVAGGATVIAVLHELGPLAPLVTRAVWLSGGRVVYRGDPARAEAELGDLSDHDPHGGLPAPAGLGFQR